MSPSQYWLVVTLPRSLGHACACQHAAAGSPLTSTHPAQPGVMLSHTHGVAREKYARLIILINPSLQVIGGNFQLKSLLNMKVFHVINVGILVGKSRAGHMSRT